MARGEISEQNIEIKFTQVSQERSALLQVVQHLRLGSKTRDLVRQCCNRQLGKGIVGAVESQSNVENNEFRQDLVVVGKQVSNTDGNLRDGTGNNVALPQHTLLLNLGESFVHVRHVRTGAHVFEGKLLQTTTVTTAHAAAATGGRGDELGERTVINRGQELIQGLANVHEKFEIDTKFFEVLEGTHLGAAENFFSTFEQLG